MPTQRDTQYYSKGSLDHLPLPMGFSQRLSELRKLRGLTQQAIADKIDLHVNQIKRYEAGTAQPTLDTLVRLAKALHVSLDELVFNEQDRAPDKDFKMQFEALSHFNDREKLIAKELLDSLILKHTANQLAASAG